MSPDTLIMQVLLSPQAKRIDFTIDGFHVVGADFAKVCGAILAKHMGLGGIQITQEMQQGGSGAKYIAVGNIMSFPNNPSFGSDFYDQLYILHESVHALQDISGPYNRTVTQAEAAAYVAMFLFAIYCGKPVAPYSSISNVATVIANRIKDKKGAAVTQYESALIQSMVALTPVYYSNGITLATLDDSDGVRL